MAVGFKLNGVAAEAEVEGEMPMLWVLREALGLTGTKFGCGIAMCGACTIHVNGEARRSCVTPAATVEGAEIVTVEGLGRSPIGKALIDAWTRLEVPQCGYCQSGQLMAAAALLSANATPSDEDIDLVMAGNICRCGTYGRIRAGIKLAAERLAEVGR
jgi:isoquinoline 1-oxidoreductase subunit alpha